VEPQVLCAGHKLADVSGAILPSTRQFAWSTMLCENRLQHAGLSQCRSHLVHGVGTGGVFSEDTRKQAVLFSKKSLLGCPSESVYNPFYSEVRMAQATTLLILTHKGLKFT
jgi:hypothetical protein